MFKSQNKQNPFKIITYGFIGYALIGVILISLPFAQKVHVGFVDNLFNIVSALSTTGLTTGSISELYTTFGHIILLCLIELGAIGYMTLTSFFILSRSDNISNNRVKILSAEFPLPQGFDVKRFVKNVIIYTVGIELIGTVLLYLQFLQNGIEKPLWSAIFHSVSAFATAGFSLFSDSLMQFRGNIPINLIIIFLCYSGAIGFIVSMDIYRRLTGKSKEITLTSKIIVIMTVLVGISGALIYCFAEQSGFLSSFFQIMSASTTAGFNTVDLAQISKASLLLIIFAMIIGASPSGTGGGIKSTSISVLLGIIGSVINGHPEKITFLNKRIPENRVMTAVATATTYVIILSVSTLLICLFDNHSFLELYFETASALGTVGLSLGITSTLSTAAKIILTVTMFLGRLGPLTLGIAFFRLNTDKRIVRTKCDVAV